MSGQLSFATLGIRERFVNKLKEEGVAVPTPIQEASIPVLMAGKDLIAQAQTGTGKTLAFALPLLEKFNPDKPHIQGLIITPTRELALQITTEMRKLGPLVGAHILPVYGGQDVEAQSRKLKGSPAIVVCTPGRLLDHMRRGTVSLGYVRTLVLDEADQMLHMGFLAEVEAIISQVPRDRQTMLFSATMPDQVKKLARNYMKNPQDIRIQGKQVTLEDIKQFVVETTDRAKQATLFRILELYQPYLGVIFCRTKLRAKKLTEAMQDHGFNVDELHGDLSQAKREQVMEKFRKAHLQYLVATDVAARGLDIEGVTHVFNYDIPLDAESYIHRIGRTGRAQQKGTAVTMVAAKDRNLLLKIEQGIKTTLKKRSMEEFGVNVTVEDLEEESTDRKKGSFVKTGSKTGGFGGGPRSKGNRSGGGGAYSSAKKRSGDRGGAAPRSEGARGGKGPGTGGRSSYGGKPAEQGRGEGRSSFGGKPAEQGRGEGRSSFGRSSENAGRSSGGGRGRPSGSKPGQGKPSFGASDRRGGPGPRGGGGPGGAKRTGDRSRSR